MRHLLLPLPVLLLLLLAGCESLQFRGTSPNVRSFSEDPNLAQYYIGFDLEFAVTDPPLDPNKPESAQSLAEPQPPEDPDVIPQPLPEPKFLPW